MLVKPVFECYTVLIFPSEVTMQRVLDLDLDFFLSDCCALAPLGSRPPAHEARPWKPERVDAFLSEHLRLSKDTPLAARIFETHDRALGFWAELMESGRLTAPFHVTHVDAHSDLGIGRPGPHYVLKTVLSMPPNRRTELALHYERRQLDEANYLLFALAFRWIASLEDVRIPRSRPDLPQELFSLGPTTLCLPQAFPSLFEPLYGKEPVIPFYHTQKPDSFFAEAPYDFVSLALSPRFAPADADALLSVFAPYFLLE